ncbi:MAG: hypothetical protein KKA60_09715 [Proteobacteria bacterium]|nr:hypothetical protein [Pseudomonadota bacterium]
MKQEERSSLRTYAWTAAGLVAFFILAAVVISFWGGSKAPKSVLHPAFRDGGQGGPMTADGRAVEYTPGQPTPAPAAKAAGNGEEAVEEDEDAVHPLLANVEVEELIPEEEPEETDPEKLLAKRMVKIMTGDLSEAAAKLPSFRYDGTMAVTIPTPVKTEAEYNEGKRFVPGIEVTGSFVLTKDEEGNFRLEQETKTSQGGTEYDGEAYNGVLYKVAGEYSYRTLSGETVSQETLDKVLATYAQNSNEPLVYRNWSQIVKDLSQVVGFSPVGQGPYQETYELSPANPEVQQSTVELSSLSGGVSVLPQYGVMGDGSLAGAGVMRRGYMSGAPISYNISMKMTQMGEVEPIKLP